jgi:predicted DNA-binding protein
MNIPIENEDGEVVGVVTAAQQVASIVQGTGRAVDVGSTKVTSVRLPINLLSQIQGLAHKSGKTRNSMIAMLLEVGVDEVKAQLSPETLEQLSEVTSEYLDDLLGEV